MLNIGNKTFMNLQEAVGWLLENNALPFQSTANYAGGVEIAMSTLINPSPAKVRVGSIIFFADSKVSTVVGVTSNSFIVSDQYNDLVDDVVYVSNVAQNASGHLIVTLSNGDTIDAGLIKQVSNFNINASQHLIVTYNDGSTSDLGALGDFSNVDFVAKTLSQAQPNWSAELIMRPSSYITAANLIFTNIYNRIEVINGVLYVIVNASIENNTGSAVNLPAGTWQLDSYAVDLPSDLADKIVDLNGKKVSEVASPDYSIITGARALVSEGLGYQSVIDSDWDLYFVNRGTANRITVFMRTPTSYTLANATTLYLSARIPLTIL